MPALPPQSRINTFAVCYGCAYLATISMKTIYSTFLVSVVLQGYKLPLEWFYFGQTVLGLWNAVDDSLAAVVSSYLHKGESDALKHVNAYLYGAPFLVTAFLIPFFPWSTTNPTLQGAHFCISVCCWDAAMSYVGVSHNALGTDISGHLVVRTRCKKMEMVALTVTSFVIGAATIVYDSEDLGPFRRFIVANAATSLLLLLAVHRVLRAELLQEVAEAKAESASEGAAEEPRVESVEVAGGVQTRATARRRAGAGAPGENGAADTAAGAGDAGARLRDKDDSMLTKIKQTAANRNFRCWIVMQFCVYCNTVFQTKFYHMFSQALFPGTIAHGYQGPLLSTSHVIRSLASVFLVLPAVETHGIYPIFRIGCMVQLCAAGIGGVIAYNFHMLLPYVFMLNVVACSHKVIVSMFIADLTDEDLVNNLRPRSQSAFFFSIRSLFTVWGDSAVPIFVVWLMTRVGIEPSNSMAEQGAGKERVLVAIWWGVPFALAVVKLICSSYFTLKSDYLNGLKRRREQLVRQALRDASR